MIRQAEIEKRVQALQLFASSKIYQKMGGIPIEQIDEEVSGIFSFWKGKKE